MYSYIILFLMSMLFSIYAIPQGIRSHQKKGIVVQDMYKRNKPSIPTNLGIIVLFSSFTSIALFPLIIRLLNQINNFAVIPSIELSTDFYPEHLALLLVISIYSIYGLVDDILEVNRPSKVFLPLIFAYPLIPYIQVDYIWLPILGDTDLTFSIVFDINLNDIFRVVIIPIYIMVVANLINMHSGFNGLQTGLSIILLLTLIFHSWLKGSLDQVSPAFAFLGSMTVFLYFNFYPSRAFEGNIGSLLFGSLIGSIIVINKYWWFGFFILIPHTINFILWIIWLRYMRKDPAVYLENNLIHKKFGRLRKDGTIAVPNNLTLKWIPNYYWRINERSSILISYMITLLFCLFALMIFNI